MKADKTGNKCYWCQNAYIDKCPKIGKYGLVEGLIFHNGEFGYIIDYCPNFKKDINVTAADISKILGIGETSFYKLSKSMKLALARSKGYELIIDLDPDEGQNARYTLMKLDD